MAKVVRDLIVDLSAFEGHDATMMCCGNVTSNCTINTGCRETRRGPGKQKLGAAELARLRDAVRGQSD